MSKTVDALERVSLKKKSAADDIQDQLARTYFHSSPLPEKNGAPAASAHSASRSNNSRGKNKRKNIIPWFVAALALAIAVLAVVFRSSFDVKIRVMGEIPFSDADKVPYQGPAHAQKGIYLIEGGEPNRDLVKDVYFSGDAGNFSTSKADEIVLCNSRGSGWANYTVEFKEGLDLNKVDIRYMAKGARGDEFLVPVLIDGNSRSYRLEKDISSALSGEWRNLAINLGNASSLLGLKMKDSVRIDFDEL